MLILLPPSEGKAGPRRGRPVDLAALPFPELAATRERVLRALAQASARPDAAEVLGVSPRLGEEIARNTRLRTAPAAVAGAVYTGVLYAALGLDTLDPAALRRARRWVVVQSALYGAVRLGDRIAPYRLSMGVSLPGIGALASVWRAPLAAVMPGLAGRGVVLDCRSGTYAVAWTPPPGLATRWVQVRVPGATHQAKHTRGLVAREICRAGADPRSVPELAAVLSERFTVTLTGPARPGRPWVLDAVARSPRAGAAVS